MRSRLISRAAFALLVILGGGYCWAVIAAQTSVGIRAEESNGPTNPSVRAGTPIADDLVTAGPSVHVDGDVGGDVAAAGSEVTIDGRVTGYVMSAGRTVTLEGPIGNDVWAAGETVNVASEIGNNAMIAGRVVHLQRDTIVGHDASLAGDTVTSEGRVERNLRIGADTARIGGDIGGGVEARAARVSVLPGTVIRGDLIVRAPQPPEISDQAQVLGVVRYERISATEMLNWPRVWLVVFAALLLLGLAASAFSPEWPARVASTIRARIAASILSGLFFLVVLPILIAAFAVTVVGLPLALTLLAIYTVILLLSSVFVSYRVGEWLLKRMRRVPAARWLRMVLGMLVVSLGISLPLVGWAVALTVMIIGTGAILLERLDHRARLHYLGLA
jgi:hypothetical protein